MGNNLEETKNYNIIGVQYSSSKSFVPLWFHPSFRTSTIIAPEWMQFILTTTFICARIIGKFEKKAKLKRTHYYCCVEERERSIAQVDNNRLQSCGYDIIPSMYNAIYFLFNKNDFDEISYCNELYPPLFSSLVLWELNNLWQSTSNEKITKEISISWNAD